MAENTAQGAQLFNDGAVIRVEKNGKTLLVAKDQVKTIDIVHGTIVRIDIGEGALRNIFLNYQEVTTPSVGSANELRDAVKEMMLSDDYDGGDAKEATQVSILNQLAGIASILQGIREGEEDFSKSDPTLTDESNPNTVYKGWHGFNGSTSNYEWAILRIRKVDDLIIYEWADGVKAKTQKWDDRESLGYAPIQYGPRP